MLHWNCFNNKAHSRIRSVRSKSGLVRMFYLPGDGVDLLDDGVNLLGDGG